MSFLPNPPQLQLISLSRVHTRVITFISFLGVSALLPALIHNQFITGPIINALLFLSVAFLSRDLAILIGIIPSTVAISRGLLPIAMAPMMPFIILANTLLIIVFARLKDLSQPLAILLSSLVKAGFLSLVTALILPQLVPTTLATQLQANFSWVQLITALSGGMIYWLVVTATKTNEFN